MKRRALAATILALGLAFAPVARAADVRVRVLVTVPASTPVDARIGLSGDLPALGSWDGAGFALSRGSDGRHGGELRLPAGSRLEYKVTRGSWDTVEKDAAGAEMANRTLLVTADTTVVLTVAAWRDQVEDRGPAAPRPTTLTGDIRRHAGFASSFVRPRDVWVWFPPGYAADSTRRYPVLYFHDGNNVFDRATSFLGVEWEVDETAGRLVRAGTLPPFIAVAVANSPDRKSEYAPAVDARHGGGGAPRYARFLLEELKPFVDSTYRTDPRPAATGTVGSSLGAVVSLWLGLEHPGAFTRIGAVSPAAWLANRDLVRRASTAADSGLRVWIDIGTEEGGDEAARRRTVDEARALSDALVARGYREGEDLHFEVVAGGRHDEAAWAARVGRMLRFLLADPPGGTGR